MTHVHVAAEKNTKNAVVVRKPFVIEGFRVNAVSCNMRYSGRLDLALIATERFLKVPVAAVFTQNLFAAAPVEVSRRHLKSSGGMGCAVLINSGIANACTGDRGIKLAEETCRKVAKAISVSSESVLVASTGVIGPHIKVKAVEGVLPELVNGLAPDKWDSVAKAIMTTDTVPKSAYAEMMVGGETVKVGGVAKGSGMIAPNMATMLAFLCTNVHVNQKILQEMLAKAVDESFNRITVDGDTSTNDTVMMFAAGPDGVAKILTGREPEAEVIYELICNVCRDLACQIVEDGEGATKFVEITVTGAASKEDAKRIAKCIAESPLVKTAFYGGDANWGRIVAAAGRAGVRFDPKKVSLYFDDLCVFKDGVPVLLPDVEKRASEVFGKDRIFVKLVLREGIGEAAVWTCDLSHGYVDINASYRT